MSETPANPPTEDVAPVTVDDKAAVPTKPFVPEPDMDDDEDGAICCAHHGRR